MHDIDELSRLARRMTGVAALLIACLLVGVIGYRVIEGWGFFDGLYMTVITLATVGYGEVHPLSPAGRWFTMVLILGGIAVATYGFSALTAIVIEGELSQALRRRRMEKKIDKMKGHYVICGAGHTGGVIAAELGKTGREFVMVDREDTAIDQLKMRLGFDFPAVVGDGSDDEVLRRAGVDRAAGVFAVLATDQDNAFVVLSARGLNPTARVLACQKSLGVRDKLFRSGADGVVDPEFIGGMRLASEMIRPATVGFLDSMLREKGEHVRFDELALTADSPLVGKTAAALRETGPGHPLLVAVVPAGSDRYEINPADSRTLEAGDRLVMIGGVEPLRALRKRASVN